MPLTVIILTKNEELHIKRAIDSVASIANRCLVVDSGSTDLTVSIAREAGAEVISNEFVTQAKQFNWALKQLPEDTDWIFRLDADEVASPELVNSIATQLPKLECNVTGVEVHRRIAFMGKPIKWGGLFPLKVVRLFRYGFGKSEDRWMDEHITVDGSIAKLNGELLDDNLKSLTWWIEKHNSYASREVVEMLDDEFGILQRTKRNGNHSKQASFKRFLKERIYSRFPIGARAFVYFFYRYFFRLGILDGKEGTAFHVLQGFWYRYLVDTKYMEVKSKLKESNEPIETLILDILGIDVSKTKHY